MSRRQKILLVVAILFVLAALIMLLLPYLQAPETVNAPEINEPTLNRPIGGLIGGETGGTNAPVNVVGTPAENVPTPAEPTAPTPGLPDERTNVTRVAMAFTERFGSFSNTSDFSNILDQEPIMTSKMIAWAEKYVADQRASTPVSAEYFGTTTRSLSATLSLYDDLRGFATVNIMTQRRETMTTGVTSTYLQPITVEMRKTGGLWKVDSATWGTRQ